MPLLVIKANKDEALGIHRVGDERLHRSGWAKDLPRLQVSVGLPDILGASVQFVSPNNMVRCRGVAVISTVYRVL